MIDAQEPAEAEAWLLHFQEHCSREGKLALEFLQAIAYTLSESASSSRESCASARRVYAREIV